MLSVSTPKRGFAASVKGGAERVVKYLGVMIWPPSWGHRKPMEYPRNAIYR